MAMSPMQSNIDLSWIPIGRNMEVESIDGGRASNEFTLGPSDSGIENDEELPVNLRAVDDAEETEQRVKSIEKYVPYAQRAYAERGLSYPFRKSDSGDSLVVLPSAQMRDLAVKTVDLNRIISTTGGAQRNLEKRGFNALHTYLGGVGACVGASRVGRTGPKRAVEQFRTLLLDHERGDHHDQYPANGDLGADGFIVLGRPWVGPLIFYQSKNTPFDMREFPAEFSQVNGIGKWFGRALHRQRPIFSVFAANTLLTMAARESIFETQGNSAVMIIDAADILAAEMNQPTVSNLHDPLNVPGDFFMSLLAQIDWELLDAKTRSEQRRREQFAPWIGVFRWWARRPSSVVGALLDAGRVLFGNKFLVSDVFSGGGTVGFEAAARRLPVYAQDLYPWPTNGLAAGLRHTDPAEFKRASSELLESLKPFRKWYLCEDGSELSHILRVRAKYMPRLQSFYLPIPQKPHLDEISQS